MRAFSSLRGRLLLVVGVALVPLLGLLLLARARLAESAREDWREDAVRLAETAATGHAETLRRTQWLLEALARVPATADPDPGLCESLFGDYYASRDYYTAFGVVRPDGVTSCTLPDQEPMDLSARPYFRNALEERRTSLSDYHIGRLTGRPVVTMATPVFGPDSTVVALLAAGIDLSRLEPLPEGFRLPPGAHISVLDATGHVLYHAPDPEVVSPGDTVSTAVRRMVYGSDRDTVAFLEMEGVGPRTYVASPVRVPGWDVGARVLVSFDPAVVQRQIDEAARSGYLGVGLAALLLVIGVWGAVELLVLRRIAPVVDAADRLGRGDLDARAGVGEGEDEIGRLGRAFDAMAVNLQSARKAEAERARLQVAESEERFELLAKTIDEVFWIWDPVEGRYEYLSPAFDAIWGVSRETLMADSEIWTKSMHPEDRERLSSRMVDEGTLAEGEHEYRIVRPDGEVRWIASRTFAVPGDDGEPRRYLGVAQDVTEHKALEEAVIHGSKLEAVGRLAGGVAHDFNNILTAVQGHARLMEDSLPGDHPTRQDLAEIIAEVQRAAGLTRQLLTFSRKQEVRPEVLDLNRVVRSTALMVGRLIGEDVDLNLDLADDTPPVEGDRHQIEQVIMNLVVNARDAMPHGGTLEIGTRSARLESAEAFTVDVVEPGEYAVLRVRDSGRGMGPGTLEHVFEPFFTTKPLGEGTGLGLATVYGIVKGSGGSVGVETAEGEGTTFSIYLPAAPEGELPPEESEPAPAPEPDAWNVLLVEDEEAVRSVMIRMLERLGCTVTAAAAGPEALALVEDGLEPDVLVTDVVMPGMNGVRLHERVRELLPDLPVVFMSGYPGYGVDDGALEGDHPFLQKPFSVEDLTAALAAAVRSAPGRTDG